MSIATEIAKLQSNLEDSYDACEEKFATMPASENFDNLPDTIESIPQGWRATIQVSTESGATVTCGSQTVVAEYGTATLYAYEEGTYTVTATLDGHTNTNSVYVYSASTYYISIPLKSSIVANAPVGTEVTCNSETKTVESTSVTFEVWGTGTYSVVGVLNGSTVTNTVNVSYLGGTFTTTLVFGCYVNIHSNVGTDVVYNGLRQTVGDSGYVRYWITGNGTYKFLCIYKGQSKEKDVVVTSTASDIDENIYFIPSGYQEVEYLKSDGYSWIDTGVSSDVTASWNIKTRVMNFDNNRKIIIGSYLSDNESCLAIEFGGTSNSHARQIRHFIYSGPNTGGSHYEWISQACTLNTILDTKLIWDYTTKQLYTSFTESNYTYSTTNNYSSYTFRQTGTSNFLLFSDSRASKAAISYPLSIYSCTIEKNGTIARAFIPCKRTSDSVLGMYDTVTDTFYTNAGTGSFTAGSLVDLPSEYQQVEYLQSSGTQYIDTGVNNTTGVSQFNIKVKFEVQSSGSAMSGIWGSVNRTASTLTNDLGFNTVQLSNNRPNLFTCCFTTSTTQLNSHYLYHNTVYDLECEYKNNISRITCDNQTQTYNNTTATKYFTNNIYLFASNDTAIGGKLNGKIYSCSIEMNNSIVRNYIPCYRKSDSVAGMYDLVNGVFYQNAGTGTFTCGNPIANASLPSEYTYVKYVASTSAKTQYLNLGETGTNTSGMLIKVYDELEDITKDNVYVGGRATQNGRFWIGGTYWGSDIQKYLTYLGWNTLKRLINAAGEYTENISATKILRTFYINYLNNRQEGYDNTKAFDINETLVQSTPLYAFAASNNGSLGLNSWMRLYYAVLTSGTNISNIFIPCYRNSDNVIGMYDIVKGNFKTNAGSGSFVDGGYLPSTYQQVEYLQSSGTQYINTGWHPISAILEVDFKVTCLLSMATKSICGSEIGPTNPSWLFTLYGQNNDWRQYPLMGGWNNKSGSGYHITTPQNTEVSVNLKYNNGVTTCVSSQGDSWTHTQSGDNITAHTVPLNLFKNKGDSQCSSIKMYHYRIFDNGNIVRNFIPCYRKSDNAAGMFDTENMVFYTNDGTGSFAVGPDVN